MLAARGSDTRRARLLAMLRSSTEPITGQAFSQLLGVSRQAIVNDIAILRAAGSAIIGSSRGYRLDEGPPGLVEVIHSDHGPERVGEEAEILLDRGIAVLDVGVNHSVLGEIRAPILVESRADLEGHLEVLRRAGDLPLSTITRGIHSHTLRAPNRDALDAAKRELADRGILLRD
jgi:hypothetical protein